MLTNASFQPVWQQHISSEGQEQFSVCEGETDAVLAPVSEQACFQYLVNDIYPLSDSRVELALEVCKGGIHGVVPVNGVDGDRCSRIERRSSDEDGQ